MKKSLKNLPGQIPLPNWARKKKINNCFFYSGKSMQPTFQTGQLLYTMAATSIRPGDIVIFREPRSRQITVHRVVSLSPKGFITRGDNNSSFDPVPVVLGQIVGKVEFFEINGRIRAVSDPKRQLQRLRRKWKFSRIARKATFPIRFVYVRLRKSGLIRFLFGRWFAKRVTVIHLNTPAGLLTKLLFRGKVIAVKRPGQRIFAIKKPFDLLIDEKFGGLKKKR